MIPELPMEVVVVTIVASYVKIRVVQHTKNTAQQDVNIVVEVAPTVQNVILGVGAVEHLLMRVVLHILILVIIHVPVIAVIRPVVAAV